MGRGGHQLLRKSAKHSTFPTLFPWGWGQLTLNQEATKPQPLHKWRWAKSWRYPRCLFKSEAQPQARTESLEPKSPDQWWRLPEWRVQGRLVRFVKPQEYTQSLDTRLISTESHLLVSLCARRQDFRSLCWGSVRYSQAKESFLIL